MYLVLPYPLCFICSNVYNINSVSIIKYHSCRIFTHEFVIIAETGESKIFTDKIIFDLDSADTKLEKKSLDTLRKKYEQFYSVTDEKYNKEEFEKKVSEQNRLKTKGIEVGHIFYFGDKYSKPMGGSVDLPGGKKDFVKMGSYGIGVSRLVCAIIEP